MGRRLAKPGEVFGPYTVVRATGRKMDNGSVVYEVVCKCGREYTKASTILSAAASMGTKTCRACWVAPCIAANKQRDAKIVTADKAGATLGELALRFGITRQRVHQILVRNGHVPRPYGKKEPV